MDKYVIHGGHRLAGEVDISGAKNAAVAVIAGTLLADTPCRIENIPDVTDVQVMTHLLKELGGQVHYPDRHTVEIDPRTVDLDVITDKSAQTIRASYYYIGALLGRSGRATVPMPGGCDFGIRPIDQHLKAFAAMGCDCSLDNGRISVDAVEGLHGANIYMDVVTVGATINTMLAAVKARGLTVIENAAREPHVVDLANFLNTMGADVRGAGTDTIRIHGVHSLRGTSYAIIPDQIEAGTYMVAAAATGGDVTVRNVTPQHLEAITAKLEEIGAIVEEGDDTVRVICSRPLRRCNVRTMPHPGFPTDMQPQITALLSVAQGTSIINDGIWDRFKYVEELHRMGAQITVNRDMAVVEGVEHLKGAGVRAFDLRAGAALVIAGLMASGVTEIEDVKYIERGFENIVDKLVGLGADIYRGREPDSVPLGKLG